MLPCLIFGFLIAAVAAISIAVSSQRTKSLNDAYGQLARRCGGQLHEAKWFQRPSVTFHYRSNWVRVDIHSTGGKNPTYYTQVHMGWPQAGFRCEVYPEGFFNRIGKLLGLEDIEIGSPAFDRDYIITGSDPAALRELLNIEVQSIINKLRSLQGGGVYVAVRNYELLVKKQGMIDDPQLLEYFTRLALQLYDAALVPVGQGIAFVDGPASPSEEAPVCQVCGDAITSDLVYCKACKTPHHHDCWQYYGQCSTFGCRERACYRPRSKTKTRR